MQWANPFCSKEAVSLRVRNFESGQLKVNDSSGNPIEIAAAVVWKVVDSAEQGVVELDNERRAVMVSNLLVVLCGEENAQPVLNAGSLYQ